MFKRLINLPKSQSFFLFGARGTGKSTMLKELFSSPRTLFIDLLDRDTEWRLSRNPGALKDLIDSDEKIDCVVIDEVQKIPEILDTVHQMIESKKIRFVLTGSSARKLKRGAANMLAGRAVLRNLYPLTHLELEDKFNLNECVSFGSLPAIFGMTKQERFDFLLSYTETYLKEEIIAEQLVRKLRPFRAFLEVAAQHDGKVLNYSAIAKDIDSDSVSVSSYFDILEDTLLGFRLEPFHTSVRKRVRKAPKFYFFDNGVRRALLRDIAYDLKPQTSFYGEAFESFIIQELHRLAHYKQNLWKFFYIQTKDGAEIDIVIDRPRQPLCLIEIKSKTSIGEADLRHITSLGDDFKNSVKYCFSLDTLDRKISGVHCLHWQKGFEAIGLSFE